jgi:hypothetical protein
VGYKGIHFGPEHYKPEQSNLLLRGLCQLLKAGEIEQVMLLKIFVVIF